MNGSAGLMLRERCARWVLAHDTLGARVAVAMGSMALLVILLVTGLSYYHALAIAQGKESEWMASALKEESAGVAEAVAGFSAVVAGIAREELVTSALVDKPGGQRHLVPFLQLTRATLGRKIPAGSVESPLSLWVLDYRGNVLARAGGIAGQSFSAQPWVASVIDGRPHAELIRESRVLRVAYPIRFSGTGLPEGIAMGEIDLRALPVERPETSSRWQARLGTAEAVSAFAANPGLRVLSARVPLDPALTNIDLRVALAYPLERDSAEAWSVLRPYLLTLCVLVIAAAGVGIRVGRKLALPLERLAQAAALYAAGGGHGPIEFPDDRHGPGEVRSLLASVRHAFEQLHEKTAEMRLAQAALAASGEGVMIADARAPGWPLIYMNAAAERLTGYSPADSLGGAGALMHQHGAPQEALEQLRVALEGGARYSATLVNLRQDGTQYWNQLAVDPLRDANGTVTHFIGLQSDVTARLRTEEHLRGAQKLEALGQLTGGLAHDFNNLLGVVIGNLDLLAAQAAGDERATRRIDVALSAALRGAEVTRSLLAVARRQPLEPQQTGVNQRLREVGSLLASTAGARVEMQTVLCEGEALAHLDVSGFDSALLNLVINARDAMGEQGGRLVLSTSNVVIDADNAVLTSFGAKPGAYVVVDVSDTGCGMSKEVAERAFEPFFTTKGPGKGTGLGLPMVYGFARQSGGMATLHSEPGKGTSVRLYLPAAGVPVAAKAPAEQSRARAAGTALVVDDEVDLADVGAAWLRQFGYEVQVAHNAAQARELLESRGFDLMLTDVVMPGEMDGIGLARWGAERDPGMQIIIVSGFSEKLLDENLPWKFFEKPYRKGDLAAALGRAA